MNQETLDNIISRIELFLKSNKRIILKCRFVRFIRFDKNQMIISKNPQFTGISARQQLEFTTHLLLTD